MQFSINTARKNKMPKLGHKLHANIANVTTIVVVPNVVICFVKIVPDQIAHLTVQQQQQAATLVGVFGNDFSNKCLNEKK